MLGFLFIAVIAIFCGIAFRTINHNYTIGSGMFKSSEDNLEKEKQLDVSDYDYYNKDGKLK